MLQQETDWRLEGGSLYVIPSRLLVEAQKLRPEIEYVNMKSDESEKASEKSTETISNDNKLNSNESKRNHLKSTQSLFDSVILVFLLYLISCP